MIKNIIKDFVENELGLKFFTMIDTKFDGSESEYSINAICIDPNNESNWTHEYFMVRHQRQSIIHAEVFHMPLEKMKCLYAFGEKIK